MRKVRFRADTYRNARPRLPEQSTPKSGAGDGGRLDDAVTACDELGYLNPQLAIQGHDFSLSNDHVALGRFRPHF